MNKMDTSKRIIISWFLCICGLFKGDIYKFYMLHCLTFKIGGIQRHCAYIYWKVLELFTLCHLFSCLLLDSRALGWFALTSLVITDFNSLSFTNDFLVFLSGIFLWLAMAIACVDNVICSIKCYLCLFSILCMNSVFLFLFLFLS